jgi:hypothetical protein
MALLWPQAVLRTGFSEVRTASLARLASRSARGQAFLTFVDLRHSFDSESRQEHCGRVGRLPATDYTRPLANEISTGDATAAGKAARTTGQITSRRSDPDDAPGQDTSGNEVPVRTNACELVH